MKKNINKNIFKRKRVKYCGSNDNERAKDTRFIYERSAF